MAFDTLLNHVPVARENIHIMQTENISPEESANAYETILKQYFPTFDSSNSKATTFDLVLLGVGDDGHTLSLFPGKTEVIQETEKLCTSVVAGRTKHTSYYTLHIQSLTSLPP